MKHASAVVAFAAIQICSGSAIAQDCKEIEATATKGAVRFPGYMSGHSVIGEGRLHFFSAPDRKCALDGVFILPGESVQAYMEYKGFTLVMYMNPSTGKDSTGWVDSARLKANGTGIAPRQ